MNVCFVIRSGGNTDFVTRDHVDSSITPPYYAVCLILSTSILDRKIIPELGPKTMPNQVKSAAIDNSCL